MRVRCLDRLLLGDLFDPLEHGLEQTARGVQIALHRVQRHLRLGVLRDQRLLRAQIPLQGLHPLAVGAHFRLGRGDHAAGLGGNGPIHVDKLRPDRQHVRMRGAEPAEHRLQLARQLVVTRAQLHHRWRDRRLRRRAGPAARRIEPTLGLGQRIAGVRHVLAQQADLLAAEARVHGAGQQAAHERVDEVVHDPGDDRPLTGADRAG